MSSVTRPQGEVKKWRVIFFVIVGGLVALLALYAGARDLLLLDGQPGFPSEVHRWHEAQSGVFTALLFGGSLLALLWRPLRKPPARRVRGAQSGSRQPGLCYRFWCRFQPTRVSSRCSAHLSPCRCVSRASRLAAFQASRASELLPARAHAHCRGVVSPDHGARTQLAAPWHDRARCACPELPLADFRSAGLDAHPGRVLSGHTASGLAGVGLPHWGQPSSTWGALPSCSQTMLAVGESRVECSDCSLGSATSQPRWWRLARRGRRPGPRPPTPGASRRRRTSMVLDTSPPHRPRVQELAPDAEMHRSEKGSSSYADGSALRRSRAGSAPRVSLAAPQLPVLVSCGEFGYQCSQSRITEYGCAICDWSARLYAPLHQWHSWPDLRVSSLH